MGDISNDFNRSEFECSCGECGLDTVDAALLALLQDVRDKFGTLKVTSGHRCEDYNNFVGGSKNSYHLQGRAADIVPLKADIIEVANYIESTNHQGGMGVYPDKSFIHLDTRSYKARWRG
jgi:uncharacterized protein YcbK (DUF882 family)